MAIGRKRKVVRHKARGNTVVPFPRMHDSELDTLEAEKIDWEQPEALKDVLPQFMKWGKRILERSVTLKRIRKVCMQSNKMAGKTLKECQREYERELVDLFDFLGDVDLPAKMDLVEKFNQKVNSGEIASVQEMKAFMQKAHELAACLRLYLHRNEYCAHFMKEISFEVFEKGFSPTSQNEVMKQFPDYFE